MPCPFGSPSDSSPFVTSAGPGLRCRYRPDGRRATRLRRSRWDVPSFDHCATPCPSARPLAHDPDQATVSSNCGLGFHTWQPDLASTTHAPAYAGTAVATMPADSVVAAILHKVQRVIINMHTIPRPRFSQCGNSGTTIPLSNSSRTSMNLSRTLPSTSMIQVIGTPFGMPNPSSVMAFATAIG